MRNLHMMLSLLVLVMCHGMTMTMAEMDEAFLLQHSRPVVKTDAGYMRIVRSVGGKLVDNPMHIAFITMEPKSLFVPQYADSSLTLFVRKGEARVGSITAGDLVEKHLKAGDIYRIPAGTAFYLVNTEKAQRLHIISSIDSSESVGFGDFQSFFIAGGRYPTSVLSGFGTETLTSALNVSKAELKKLLTKQVEGPIVHISKSQFLQLKEQDRLEHLKRMVDFHQKPQEEEEEEEGQEQENSWSWRKLLFTVFETEIKKSNRRIRKSSESYNIYNRNPNFKNDYGWTTSLDESDYSPLKHSGIGVYLVNLTKGSMMAPHVNPSATEYGIVLRGHGTIQIVFPNGTLALSARVKQGDVFWVPRYFPFCQIASGKGPFEIFGFTSSCPAHKNTPQYLVGEHSLLQSLPNSELATAFGVSEDMIKHIVNAQHEAVILPAKSSSSVLPTRPSQVDKKWVKKSEKLAKVINGFGNEMIMGFD